MGMPKTRGCPKRQENPGDDVANMYHDGRHSRKHKLTSTVGFAIFALISGEILFARDGKSGLLRFYNWRPFRNFEGMIVFSRSIHHGT